MALKDIRDTANEHWKRLMNGGGTLEGSLRNARAQSAPKLADSEILALLMMVYKGTLGTLNTLGDLIAYMEAQEKNTRGKVPPPRGA